jgi:hypothetical protein
MTKMASSDCSAERIQLRKIGCDRSQSNGCRFFGYIPDVAHKLKAADWESYWLCDNSTGVIDVHVRHVERVAKILAKGHRGIIFIWAGGSSPVMICAVKPDKRKLGKTVEEKLCTAGEKIAANVAAKHPVRARLFGWFRGKQRIKAGWHFEP